MDVFIKLEENKKIYTDKIHDMQCKIDYLENEIEKYQACVDMLNKIIESGKEIEKGNDN